MTLNPALAQQKSVIDCSTATTTVELTWCSGQELDAADRKLNAVFKAVLAHIAAADMLTPAQRREWTNAMREAQRRWIAFRDQDCGELIGWEWFGGTGMGGAMLGCKISKTEARTKELDERYSGN